MAYVEVLLAVLGLLVAMWGQRNRKGVRWNMPIMGMLPVLLLNVGRIHDICTEILGQTRRKSFYFKGPWFTNMEMLATVDPDNVHYIMSSNFMNFPKGPRFKEIFDILGEGIFNADSDSWRDQRKVARALITHKTFHKLFGKVILDKVVKGLVPVLEMVSRENNWVVDLQDLFKRFTFDTTSCFVTGYDPGCLSLDLPDVPFSKAMDDAEDAMLMRHILPESIWKLQRFLGVGGERKLAKAWKVLDSVIGNYISKKHDEIKRTSSDGNFIELDVQDGNYLLTSYISGGYDHNQTLDLMHDDKVLRDTVLNLMIAGRDTVSSALTWFIWLVSTHPEVEHKIREELNSVLPSSERQKWRVFNIEESQKLVYTHGAICETLRLYPPVPFQHKEPLQPDVLPSGHFVHPKMKILIPLYAMGRMRTIWGDDCLEFKPERWISESGKIKHVPSYKFLAFNAGPRACLGKEMAFTQMKAVAATILHNYHVRVAEGHRVVPNCSIILYMKNGLKVRVTKRLSA